MRRWTRWTIAFALLAASCSSERDAVGDTRADQLRDLARDAGLGDEVADFFALAGRGATTTYQVTYPSENAAQTLVVSQSPPNRRVDVVKGRTVAQSTVDLDGTTYQCEPNQDDELACARSADSADPVGIFGPATIDDALSDFSAAADEYTFTVTNRRIVGVDATCLVTDPKSSTERTERATLCLSDRGAILSVDAGDDRFTATGYTTQVPDGTFEVGEASK